MYSGRKKVVVVVVVVVLSLKSLKACSQPRSRTELQFC